MIDITKKYQTRDGCPVRIICTNRNSSVRPVVVLKQPSANDCAEIVVSYCIDGHYYPDASPSCHDLVEVPETKVTYITIYNDRPRLRVGLPYLTAKDARLNIGDGGHVAKLTLTTAHDGSLVPSIEIVPE